MDVLEPHPGMNSSLGPKNSSCRGDMDAGISSDEKVGHLVPCAAESSPDLTLERVESPQED